MHLAGQSGDVTHSKKVPNDVHYRMFENLKQVTQQKLDWRMTSEGGNHFQSSSFQKHNEGVTINKGGVEAAALKQVHSVRGSHLLVLLLIFLWGLHLVPSVQLKLYCKVRKSECKLICV